MIEILCKSVSLPPAASSVIREAAERTLNIHAQIGGLSVLLVGRARMRRANAAFRGLHRVTDVLSFPAGEDSADGYLGDIMICLPRARAQARAYGHSLARELAFLTVHGALHLLGYDHIEEEEERVMREKQKEILDGIGRGRIIP